MSRRLRIGFAITALPALGGCLASAAVSVVTAPVRVANKAADLATTSQSEADEKRGREVRRREEQLGKLDRVYQRDLRDCQHGGDQDACTRARDDYARMQALAPTVPVEQQ